MKGVNKKQGRIHDIGRVQVGRGSDAVSIDFHRKFQQRDGPTNRPTDRRTDGPIDRRTDQRMDQQSIPKIIDIFSILSTV